MTQAVWAILGDVTEDDCALWELESTLRQALPDEHDPRGVVRDVLTRLIAAEQIVVGRRDSPTSPSSPMSASEALEALSVDANWEITEEAVVVFTTKEGFNLYNSLGPR